MFSRICKRVRYANVAMTLALIFAMTGGAYAASKIVITSIKQIKPSVVKQLQGKGGPAGPQGLAGTNGTNGKDGANGTAGTNGTNGVSVTSTPILTSSTTCELRGGSEFTAAEGKKTTACTGKEGSPWTAGGTLPSGASEKGEWSTTLVKNYQAATVVGFATISFGIPLTTAPKMVYVTEQEGSHSPECAGTAAEPTAEEGFMCVYAGTESENFGTEKIATFAGEEVSKVGVLMIFKGGEIAKKEPIGVLVHGGWAVTG